MRHHRSHRLYVMASMTVLIKVMRKCAIVLRTDHSNVTVTSLMVDVQRNGDA